MAYKISLRLLQLMSLSISWNPTLSWNLMQLLETDATLVFGRMQLLETDATLVFGRMHV